MQTIKEIVYSVFDKFYFVFSVVIGLFLISSPIRYFYLHQDTLSVRIGTTCVLIMAVLSLYKIIRDSKEDP